MKLLQSIRSQARAASVVLIVLMFATAGGGLWASHELSNALKLVALPGEVLTVKVVKQGDQMGQGIGYLDDGTMVVVEQGRGAIGQDVLITVTSVLQTPAGRMIFGRIGGTGEHQALPPGK